MMTVLKAFQSLLVIAVGILAFLRDSWYGEGTVSYGLLSKIILAVWLVLIVCAAAFPWLDSWFAKRIRRGFRPTVSLEVREVSDSRVVLEILASADNSTPIEDLFFKFDIPGTLSGSDSETTLVNSCDVSSSFLCGEGRDETYAETVHIQCHTLLPGGFTRITIDYSPTLPRPISGAEKAGIHGSSYMPVMDLHDYSRCLSTWSYGGTSQVETLYVDLTDLTYIREDNENLIKAFRNEEFYKSTGQSLSDHQKKYDEAWLCDMEKSRKDW